MEEVYNIPGEGPLNSVIRSLTSFPTKSPLTSVTSTGHFETIYISKVWGSRDKLISHVLLLGGRGVGKPFPGALGRVSWEEHPCLACVLLSGPSVCASLPVSFLQCQECLAWAGFLHLQGDLLISKMQLLPGRPWRQALGYDYGSTLPKSELELLVC